jgi:hypothetical protein
MGEPPPAPAVLAPLLLDVVPAGLPPAPLALLELLTPLLLLLLLLAPPSHKPPMCVQPVAGSHPSVVHGSLSSQLSGVLPQLPFAGSQLSVVQASLSSQLFIMPGWQAPPEH